ncbi:VOC family protein [Paenibacillus sp. LHD-117]|uniref:VOC family protein n=1 Tax=Paenibacillus sp. LHD-117 TaxID=3071412 RepID=UPI0027DEB74F|nr:VOC family protein [Paenibacillus sp. LHD-117]MDQ6420146.1 VOC family protein [Paenibacillus sp. LHD-117]
MRILEAMFWTEEPGKLLDFYCDRMRFPVVSASEDELAVQAGATRLRFVKRERDSRGVEDNAAAIPYYHFAFNIPENKLDEAKRWIETVTELGREDGKDISRSEAWDSDSVYFMDPAGNILELIARHTMDNAIDRPFDPERDIEGMSEIGMPTKDVVDAVDQLEAIGIRSYQGRSDSFNPVGDEVGMFIVVQPGRRWHFTNLTAECYPFEATVEGIGKLGLSEGERGLRIERE